jgi:hypothetical protein
MVLKELESWASESTSIYQYTSDAQVQVTRYSMVKTLGVTLLLALPPISYLLLLLFTSKGRTCCLHINMACSCMGILSCCALWALVLISASTTASFCENDVVFLSNQLHRNITLLGVGKPAEDVIIPLLSCGVRTSKESSATVPYVLGASEYFNITKLSASALEPISTILNESAAIQSDAQNLQLYLQTLGNVSQLETAETTINAVVSTVSMLQQSFSNQSGTCVDAFEGGLANFQILLANVKRSIDELAELTSETAFTLISDIQQQLAFFAKVFGSIESFYLSWHSITESFSSVVSLLNCAFIGDWYEDQFKGNFCTDVPRTAYALTAPLVSYLLLGVFLYAAMALFVPIFASQREGFTRTAGPNRFHQPGKPCENTYTCAHVLRQRQQTL